MTCIGNNRLSFVVTSCGTSFQISAYLLYTYEKFLRLSIAWEIYLKRKRIIVEYSSVPSTNLLNWQSKHCRTTHITQYSFGNPLCPSISAKSIGKQLKKFTYLGIDLAYSPAFLCQTQLPFPETLFCIFYSPSISFTIRSAPLHQPREDQHIKNGLSTVLICYGDGGEAAVHGGAK